MTDLADISGLSPLHSHTQGDPQICVAVLDGFVDSAHPCFQGADLTRVPTLLQGEASPDGVMSKHGTHVTSIIFGQPSSPVGGIAPQCRGLVLPIFSDKRLRLSQFDLARAIEQAITAGANLINISGGQLTDFGEADGWLESAVAKCEENNILIIAAAGNDGCQCLHVPAALPAVLAVGAMDDSGQPIDYSNWGETYQTQGILALGENILGAKPGGGTMRMSGTSFATPVVSGVVALLLSLQRQWGETPNPHQVKEALLATALPCDAADTDDRRRCLVGKLNIPGAIEYLTGETMPKLTKASAKGFGLSSSAVDSDAAPEAVEASGCGCGGNEIAAGDGETTLQPAAATEEVVTATPVSGVESAAEVVAAEPVRVAETPTSVMQTSVMPTSIVPTAQTVATATPTIAPNTPSFATPKMSDNAMSISSSHAVQASQAPSELTGHTLVYALGTLGYDFGTEARRDSFKQLMPAVDVDSTSVPANPYDPRQMVDYLGENLSEAKSLIWTLNLELTPVYAIEPKGPFGRDVYAVLQELLSGQIQAEDSQDYVERVSIPALLTGRSVKLFSGQVVPVIEPQNTRGMYGWKVNTLVNAALNAVQTQADAANEEGMRRTLGSFLNRIYYDFRNLGITSQDRALNFATTNAFQAASTFAQAVAQGMELDSITTEKSPFCRLDSDCWDVKLKFFDPENNRRARKVFRFTIDVSDLIPVTLGKVRTWSTSD